MLFWSSFVLSFTALLPLINPLGSALVFVGLVGDASAETYRTLARRIFINTVLFLVTIELLGSAILNFFGLSLPIVQLAGGLVVAAIGWSLLNQSDTQSLSEDQRTEAQARVSSSTQRSVTEARVEASAPQPDEQSLALKTFYPFTFPITAGPGTIVVMLTLSAHASSSGVVVTKVFGHLGVFAAVLSLCGLVYLCYAYAPALTRRIAPNTVHGILRVIAFILLCIGAQIAWRGIASLVATLHPA